MKNFILILTAMAVLAGVKIISAQSPSGAFQTGMRGYLDTKLTGKVDTNHTGNVSITGAMTLGDGTASDQVLTFNDGSTRVLYWNDSENRFEFNYGLYVNGYAEVGGSLTVGGQSHNDGVNAITYTGTNIAWNCDNGNVQTVTLTDNCQLDNPTNLEPSATYTLIVVQDATGSRTLSFDTWYKWPGGNAPTLTTTANAIDVITFIAKDSDEILGVTNKDFQ